MLELLFGIVCMITTVHVPQTTLLSCFVCFKSYCDHRDLHSFPTRRSSDLTIVLAVRSAPAPLSRASSKRSDGMRSIAGSRDRKSTRLNSSHVERSYAVFCLKKKTT